MQSNNTRGCRKPNRVGINKIQKKMRTGLKVVLIIVVLLIGVAIIAISKEATGRGGSSGGGPLGIIITFALLAGIRAIWKYNPDPTSSSSQVQEKEDNSHKLDKN